MKKTKGAIAKNGNKFTQRLRMALDPFAKLSEQQNARMPYGDVSVFRNIQNCLDHFWHNFVLGTENSTTEC